MVTLEVGCTRHTLDDGIPWVCKRVCIDSCGTGALPTNGDSIRVPSEIGDVVVDPVDGRVDVQEPEVDVDLLAVLRWVRLSEYVEPVIYRHHNNVVVVADHVGAFEDGYTALQVCK